jgi:hypothetical protein
MGIRTHDLLHGKQSLSTLEARKLPANAHIRIFAAVPARSAVFEISGVTGGLGTH